MKYILIDFFDAGSVTSKDYQDLCMLYNECTSDTFQIMTVLVNNEEDKWKELLERFKIRWPYLFKENWWSHYYKKFPDNFLITSDGFVLGENKSIQEIRRYIISVLNK